MRKTFVTMLIMGSVVAAFAQGTVYFSNGAFQKISSGSYGSPQSWTVVPTTPGLINYGLFYGIGASQPTTLTFLSSIVGVNSTSVAGVIGSPIAGTPPITILGIPGTFPGETDTWIRIAGWSASFGTDWAAAQAASWTTVGDYFGQTGIINVAPTAGGLGSPVGPGAIIWQTATGTDPHKFAGGFTLFTVPEPSTLALFSLGVTAVLNFRRRK
jgi:hypothetical protein